MKHTNAAHGRHAKGYMPEYGSRTDVGRVRDHNEDSLTVTPPLFAVADGMGGHAAGEVASEIAIQTLLDYAPQVPNGDDLARAIVAANRAIIRAACQGVGRQGMGTTMTAAMLKGSNLIVAQVGDSRAYLLHQGRLQRITRDHSLMQDMIESGQITPEEAKFHPQRSVITRALGSDPNTLPDIYEMTVSPGDRLLLCSDGLSGMVDDPLLESILSRNAHPQDCADELIAEALAAGGHDNVTAIVVDMPKMNEASVKKEKRKGRIAAAVVVLALAALLAGTAFGAKTYLDTTSFITVRNDEVVICRGMNGTFLGMQLWQEDTATALNVDDLGLPPNTKARLAGEGIQADTVEDAKNLVKTWQDQKAQQDAEAQAIKDGKNVADAHAATEENAASAHADADKTTNGSNAESGSSAKPGAAADPNAKLTPNENKTSSGGEA